MPVHMARNPHNEIDFHGVFGKLPIVVESLLFKSGDFRDVVDMVVETFRI